MMSRGQKTFLNKAGGGTACFIFCLLFIKPLPLYAAAWVLQKGEGQAITSLSFYHSDTFISKRGNRSSQPTFKKYELNPYLEYGVSDKVTAGMSLHLPYVQQGDESSASLSDIELFYRQQLFDKKGWVFSWQPLVKIPGTYNEGSPLYGQKTLDAELRLLAGYTFSEQAFMNVETAYRARLQSVSDEMRLDGTWGWRYTEKWMLLMQGFSTFAVENSQKGEATSTVSSSDYDLVKWQGSVVYEISPEISFQAGLAKDLWGRNTGQGEGVVTALWIRF